MRRPAMTGETGDRAFGVGHEIQVGSLRRQRHGDGGERRLAVEAGARQAGSGEKVRDRFHKI